jgi:hypothetical protein
MLSLLLTHRLLLSLGLDPQRLSLATECLIDAITTPAS